MAEIRDVRELRLTPLPVKRVVAYRRRDPGSILDERVVATALMYRTYVADGLIYTQVLVERDNGQQEFMPIEQVVFLKTAAALAEDAVVPIAAADGRKKL